MQASIEAEDAWTGFCAADRREAFLQRVERFACEAGRSQNDGLQGKLTAKAVL